MLHLGKQTGRLASGLLVGVALAYLLLTIFHLASGQLANGDIFWQVRSGEMILEAGRVIDADPFSYFLDGAPWNNHQWGFEVLAAGLHGLAGWAGFRAALALLFGGLSAGLVFAWRRGHGWMAALLMLSLFVQLACYKFIPASQTLSMVIFLAAYFALGRAETFLSTGKTAALCGLLLVWGNLTAEALTFLPFLVVDMALLLLISRRDSRPGGAAALGRRPVLLLLLACCMPLLNPPGSSVLNYFFEGTSVNSLVNTEFTPIWQAAASVQPWTKGLARALMAAFVLYGAGALVRGGDRLGILRRLAPGLLAVAAAGLHERSLWLLIIPAWLLLAALLRLPLAVARPRLTGAALLLAAAVMYVPFMASLGLSPAVTARQLTRAEYYATDFDLARLPLSCVERIRAAHPGKKLFSPRLWASYVIWAAPGTKIFYDGRNREYPLQAHRAGQAMEVGGPDAARLLDATGTDLVLAPPGWGRGNAPLMRRWARAGGAANCAVFVRRR